MNEQPNEPTTNDIPAPPTAPSARRKIIAACVLVTLVVGGTLISIATLNSDWLRAQLEFKASAALNAKLRIDSIEFSPFRGAATLTGLQMDRDTGISEMHVTVDTAKLNVSVLGLALRTVNVQNLELHRPHIVARKTRPPSRPTADTTGKIKRWLDRKVERPKNTPKKKPIEWRVQRLKVHDGSFDYKSVEEGREPFEATASGFEYAATDIALNSLYRLLYGADFRTDITIGKTASLDKRGTATPATCSFIGIDMSALDRLFDQTDALRVTGGTMNLEYSITDGSTADARVTLTGLKIDQDPTASNQEFMFIPVKRIADYVRKRGGSIELSFAMSPDAESYSEDLEALAREFWKQMWIAMLKEVSPASVDELVNEGKKKAQGLLAKLKDKATIKNQDTNGN